MSPLMCFLYVIQVSISFVLFLDNLTFSWQNRWQTPSIFVCLRKYFVFTFEGQFCWIKNSRLVGFFFQHFKYFTPLFLFTWFLKKKSNVILILVPTQARWIFHLISFKIFSLWIINSLNMIWLGVDFLGFSLLSILWASWIWVSWLCY